ncbi:hypothetical protein JCM10908_005483 [Rhodotorula pacifica]|uniref:uncharacterized protein n=1 Tax=Rhodotorula pacifica TaxID=1495444 RepID=UPI00316F972C
MSAEVAAPAIAPAVTEPTVTPGPVEEPAVAPVEAETAPAAVATPAEEHDSSEAAGPGSPAPGKKRSPFGDLKNKLFHHKSSSPAHEKSHEHATPAVAEETPKENAPIVTEQKATAPVEAETAPAADTTEGGETVAPAVTEPSAHHDEEAHKKPKSPGVFDKVKLFFGENKKDKKVKTPTEEKAEPHAAAVAPVTASAEGETAAAPVVETAEGAVTAPEAVAASEANASADAPVPQVIEPIPAPIKEPPVAAEAPAAAEGETAAIGAEAKKEGEEVKFGEQTKVDDKAPKRDLAKLSRRLSAKNFRLTHPPGRRAEKDVALHIEGGEATSAEAPKIETAVDESKLDTAAAPVVAKSEPVVASETTAEPVAAAEHAPVETGPAETAPVAETKSELPAAVPVVAATA